MSTRFLIALVICGCLFGAYNYYYTDAFASINASYWTQNGVLSGGGYGLTSADSSGGSVISTTTAPGLANEYEVASSLRLTQSGGTYST